MNPPDNFAAVTTVLHNRAIKRDDLLELGRFAEAEALQREQLRDEVALARWITARRMK